MAGSSGWSWSGGWVTPPQGKVTPPAGHGARADGAVSPPPPHLWPHVGPRLAGAPLEPPRMHAHDWAHGQLFEARDDPDRTALPWAPPSFVGRVDSAARAAATAVEELRVPPDDVRPPSAPGGGDGGGGGSFARVVRGVLTASECAELIAAVNRKGFTPALVNVGGGAQQWLPHARNGHRVVVDSPELTEWLFGVVRHALPERIGGDRLVGLNERCRFLCYTPGQCFPPHTDGRYTRPAGHANAGDRSAVTLQLYLHDVPPSDGGATTFLFHGHRPLPCQPRTGSVLLFTQDLPHEGSVIYKGLKYTVRTEAMYRRGGV